MAYINQEKKAAIAPVVKAILAKYKVKGSLSVRNHSTLVLNIKSGKVNFFGDMKPTENKTERDHVQINPYWFHEHYTGEALSFLTEVMTAMNDGNHDRSDIQSDYFDVGWYVDVNIGRWDAGYVFEA